MYRWRGLIVLGVFVISLGCAMMQRPELKSEQPVEAYRFLKRLDSIIEEAKVRDASHYPVPKFPYLRTNRFLADYKRFLRTDREKALWLKWLHQIDEFNRKKEISRLPDTYVMEICGTEVTETNKDILLDTYRDAAATLMAHDKQNPRLFEMVAKRCNVPDDYSLTMRIVGVYPLLSIPMIIATDLSHVETRNTFEKPLDLLPVDGTLIRYVPQKKTRMSTDELNKIMLDSSENILNVPLPSAHLQERLATAFAPVIIQDTAADYDYIGAIECEGDTYRLNPETPAVYYYFSHMYLHDEPILQINYAFWYPRRAGKRATWIEHGRLDGSTLRISLDRNGEVFMVDTVNNCGCYHIFAPREDRIEKIKQRPFTYDAFVPQWVPAVSSQQRLGIRVISGWHQVRRFVTADISDSAESRSYILLPYSTLESLPVDNDRSRSIFNENGIARGSSRWAEPIVFFSMGIPSVGSMRQRGNHPTVLVGNEHFADPNFFNRHFIFKE